MLLVKIHKFSLILSNLMNVDVGKPSLNVLLNLVQVLLLITTAYYLLGMIKQMYSVARKGVAFNMLDNRIHIDDDIYAAYSPIEIADFCATVADRVEVVVDYLPQDFAVYLYKVSN